MANFALKGDDGVVYNIVIADPDKVLDGVLGDPSTYVEYGDSAPEGRKLAAIGWTYDSLLDALVPPGPPYASWTFDKPTQQWVAPVAHPNPDGLLEDGNGNDILFEWDEAAQNWVELPPATTGD